MSDDATESDWATLAAENGLPPGVSREVLLRMVWARLLEHRRWQKEHDMFHQQMHAENAGTLQRIEAMLTRNTEVTEEIREYWTAGKVATKALKWAGSIAAAVAAFVGLWFAFKGGGPSGGIGPTP